MSDEQFEIEPEVVALNKDYFVVGNEGGKCRVVLSEKRYFEKDQTRDVMVLMSFEDFRNWLMNVDVQVGTTKDGKPVMKPLGKYWLEHPQRRQYARMDFLPGQDTPDDVYNLWQGYAYDPKQGACWRMLRHIWVVLAKRDPEAFRYILRWAAWAVQNPGEPAEVALVFRGGKGTGKGTFCRWLKILFGQHGLQIFSSKHITGNFNAHMRDCVLLFADEAIAPNDREAENVLKGILTEPILPIECKGRDIIQAPNHLHVVMASNAGWVVPASADERRFAVFDVSDEKVGQPSKWFKPLHEEMENGGAEALLYFLLNLDLKGWHPRDNVPANNALNEQRIESLRGLDKLWFDWLWSGEPEGDPDGVRVRIVTSRFAGLAKTSARAAGDYLKDMCCEHDRNTRPTGWIVPPLQEAREIWNRKRFEVEWDDLEHWQAVPRPPDGTPF